MKVIVLSIFLTFSFLTYGQQKESILVKEDISGRWESFTYSLEENNDTIREPLNVYYFKDNMVFHRGEIVDGAIIFNITGRYSIEGDSIKLAYQDYLKHTTATRKINTMTFKVFYISPNRIDMDIIEPENLNPITLIRQGYME